MRKIPGAGTGGIIMLLFRDIVGLVLVVSVISYYVISNWLATFAYKEPIHPSRVRDRAALSLAVAFVTVTGQSWRTESADLAESLRYEG